MQPWACAAKRTAAGPRAKTHRHVWQHHQIKVQAAPFTFRATRNLQVVLHHGLTGRLRAVLGGHNGLVHCLSWAPDDSALVSASGDFTAKVWHLPAPLSAPGLVHRGSAAAAAAAASDGGGAARGSSGGDKPRAPAEHAVLAPAARCVTLQHAAFVYCAAFCPLPGLGGAVAATGGYDGVLRLWDAGSGLLLHATQVRCSARASVEERAGLATCLLGSHIPACRVWFGVERFGGGLVEVWCSCKTPGC
jgi:WD40 repeat protein